MPWQCVRCNVGRTYRRDRLCSQCRLSKRGAHNKTTRWRVTGKSPPSKMTQMTARRASTRSRSTPDVSTGCPELLWQNSLVQEQTFLTCQLQSLSASHSVLAHAHGIVEQGYREDMTLPMVTPASVLALLFCCMALSSRISDPDALKPGMLRVKNSEMPAEQKISMQQVQRLECVWVNILFAIKQSLVDV